MKTTITANWWETIFCGDLKIGINDQKTHLLEDESFLYFHVPPSPQLDFEMEMMYP